MPGENEVKNQLSHSEKMIRVGKKKACKEVEKIIQNSNNFEAFCESFSKLKERILVENKYS